VNTLYSHPTPRKPNLLAGEKSPYLLQHQFNPVHWRPWSPATLADASREQKPIFLSIGYSTCHWCHVMERESFEDEDIASFLNHHFISIKVDREERPDLDRIYMTFLQATVGQGGWPLNVFLTPDLKPFFGGTYFPPSTRQGRIGFLDLLEQIRRAWTDRRADVERSADSIHGQIMRWAQRSLVGEAPLEPGWLAEAARQLKAAYDPRFGGFGTAPKFPQPSQAIFLLRYGKRFRDTEAVRMALHTCERMAAGGIHDQLGGGFSRYSVDDQWLVPHFEKMLYDNAQLVQLYLDAFLVSGNPAHAATARDTIEYVLRDLTHPEGGFYSAEDADSEGKEGRFYCWTLAELQDLLTPAELAIVVRHFGITQEGNFLDHSDPDPLPGQNVLSIADPLLTPAEMALLASARRKLFLTRSQRVRPHLDDKILANWNGLMLGCLARAAAVLQDESYLTAARKNLAFLQARLWDPVHRRLHHRWRDGARDDTQLLDDYAFLLDGVLHFYEATLDAPDLEFATLLAEAMLAGFLDSENGGFWQAGADQRDLIVRFKDDHDGAEPSGNSVACLALLRLAAITGQSRYEDAAEATLRSLSAPLRDSPHALPHLLLALDFTLTPRRRVVIAGPAQEQDIRKALIQATHGVYQPYKVVVGTAGPVGESPLHLAECKHTTAFVCTENACLPPATTPEAVRQLLAS